jgi:hypothetical protein
MFCFYLQETTGNINALLMQQGRQALLEVHIKANQSI